MIRTERVTPYTRMVKRTLVEGVRRVFTNAFQEKQLRNLRVTTDYPMEKAQYPCVVVSFNEGTNVNAGVGHSEIFYDTEGVLREWHHRLFDGSVTFEVHALTSLDRDIIGDAIVEMLAFARLPEMSLQHNLFAHLYGTPDGLVQTLSHLAYNSDQIQPGGESVAPTYWGSENDLSYEKSYSVNLWGGYYNSPPVVESGLDFISHAFLYPKLVERIELPIWEDPDDWSELLHFQDVNAVDATAQIQIDEDFGFADHWISSVTYENGTLSVEGLGLLGGTIRLQRPDPLSDMTYNSPFDPPDVNTDTLIQISVAPGGAGDLALLNPVPEDHFELLILGSGVVATYPWPDGHGP